MFKYKKYEKLNSYGFRRLMNYRKLKSLFESTLKTIYGRKKSESYDDGFESYREFSSKHDLTDFIRALSEYDLNDDIYHAIMYAYENVTYESFNPHYDESCNINAIINNVLSYDELHSLSEVRDCYQFFIFDIPNSIVSRLDDAHAEIIISADYSFIKDLIALSILSDMCSMMNFNVRHNNMLVDVFINARYNGKYDLYNVIDVNAYKKMLAYYGTDDTHYNKYGSDSEGFAANAVNNAGGIKNLLNSYDVFSCFHSVDDVLSFLLEHHRLVRLLCGSFNINKDRLDLENILRLIIATIYSIKDYSEYPDEFLFEEMGGIWLMSNNAAV